MKHQSIKSLIEGVREVSIDRPFRVMNVCGGHERTIAAGGIRSIVSDQIQLIAGPGCPVCICPEEDIVEAIELALSEKVILLSFGDMLRVPVFSRSNQPRSLLAAKREGADIRPIASPTDAIVIASANPQRQVVFFAVGFETTMAPIAALLAEGVPKNLTILLSGRLTWPAVKMLLCDNAEAFDALIAPGHVSTIMGSNEWSFVSKNYHIPTAIAGFHGESILLALNILLDQKAKGQAKLENCYSEVVKPQGNLFAQKVLRRVMKVSNSNWRGIGVIPSSGLTLCDDFSVVDARVRFGNTRSQTSSITSVVPAGARCADVVLGKINPDRCTLFGSSCTPSNPAGPCMVSDEGACKIWLSSSLNREENKGIRKAE